MDELIALLRIFPFSPLAALLVALFFAIYARRVASATSRRRLLVVVALVWALYAPWELYISSWRSTTGDMAIRIDLLFLIPLLLIAGALGIGALLRAPATVGPQN